MNKKQIIIIALLLISIFSACENSTQTCYKYCMDTKDTAGDNLESAIQKLNIADNECKKQCIAPNSQHPN